MVQSTKYLLALGLRAKSKFPASSEKTYRSAMADHSAGRSARRPRPCRAWTSVRPLRRAHARQLPCPQEDPVDHRLGEPAGEGVLLARVVAAEQRGTAGREQLGAVAEAGLGARRERAECDGAGAQGRLPREAAEADDDPHLAQQLQLAQQVWKAGVALRRQRLVR